jgi:BirA family biotin operon repressor/biotin-[acetyl-CoA-carboxylase] ligase
MFDLEYTKKKLKSSKFSKIFYYDKLESTNKFAVKNDFPEKSILIASIQTRGRGRSSRVWESSSSDNLYFTIILPKIDIKKLLPLNIITGYSLCDTFRKYVSDASLKWPNDILIKGKKSAGILIDVKFSGNILSKVVVGIGVNVNMQEFPPSIKDIATSIVLHSSDYISRENIFTEFVLSFEKYFDNLIEGHIDIKYLWNSYSAYFNKNIQIHIGDVKQKFIERGINSNGGLIVEDNSGKLSEIYTGDIGYDFCS